jgi:hypothetical protein
MPFLYRHETDPPPVTRRRSVYIRPHQPKAGIL